jgi:hypothetical protein
LTRLRVPLEDILVVDMKFSEQDALRAAVEGSTVTPHYSSHSDIQSLHSSRPTSGHFHSRRFCQPATRINRASAIAQALREPRTAGLPNEPSPISGHSPDRLPPPLIRELTETVQAAFSGPTFRLYSGPGSIGVEIGGSIKNVVAIGAGVLHGMGMGYNASAALIRNQDYQSAVDLARRGSVEMPISEQMFQMLHFGVSPREAIQRLMERSLKGE